MARELTGMRIARSQIDNPGTGSENQEIDFNLSTNQGIKVLGVEGMIQSPPVPSAGSSSGAVQALVTEPGTIDTTFLNPGAAGSDAVESDDLQNIFIQYHYFASTPEGTNGGIGTYGEVQPNGLVVFPEPLLIATNLRHFADVTTTTYNLMVVVYYKYVEFSRDELAFLFARRR